MTCAEFISANPYHGDFEPRPRLHLKDGTHLSLQDSQYSYSTKGETVEVGFPSRAFEQLMKYAENPEEPTDTVYGHVPYAVIDSIIEECGGVAE
jgi:hypothetical protein